jgi:catechol 2,3-dioxygenase-like lactoylglutathione lyase family enzyme
VTSKKIPMNSSISLCVFFVTHFFAVRDQEKSKDFYVRILGGNVIKPENPCYNKLANTWIILNSGGGPTPDKPEVLLEAPSDLNRGE